MYAGLCYTDLFLNIRLKVLKHFINLRAYYLIIFQNSFCSLHISNFKCAFKTNRCSFLMLYIIYNDLLGKSINEFLLLERNNAFVVAIN